MSILEAIVLGLVQGLSEFIPISSSGHLVIVPALLGWDHPGLAFDVLLHAASLVALLVYFSGDLLELVRGTIRGARDSRRLLLLLVIGTIPAGLAGILLGDFFEEQFEDAKGAALQLLITAVILVGAELLTERNRRRSTTTGTPMKTQEQMTPAGAGAIGIAQALAIIPGISRSGSTIGAGLWLGMDRESAARFAFLLAIPALAGAALVQLPELGSSTIGLGAGVAGFIASLVSSYIAVAGLIRYLKSRTLYPFAAYVAIAAVVFCVPALNHFVLRPAEAARFWNPAPWLACEASIHHARL